MKSSFTRLTAVFATFALLSGSAYSQSGLPLNAAASVNGTVITNDAVEQGMSDYRQIGIQFEAALCAKRSDELIVGINAMGRTDHKLRDYRVDLTGHDRTANLALGNRQ